jgi:hypothetical protein
MPLMLQVDSGFLSIDKCVKILDEIARLHWIFRTRLSFDVDGCCLRQKIHENIRCQFSVSAYNGDEEKQRRINKEVGMAFDTEHDGVFRCHFFRRYDYENQDKLFQGDVIVFNFHHGSFDGQAMDLFAEQFKLGYEGQQLQSPNLQYIDYSIHERNLSMTEAESYWHAALNGYGWDRRLKLGELSPTLLSARRRSQGSSISIPIPSEIVQSIIKCTDRLNVTLFQLGLTCFYLFLAQISPYNRDACIGINHLNRYRTELTSMLGMFVNVLPCRISIDKLDTMSFLELIDQVQQIFLAMAQHSYLPYDQLINLHRVSNSCLQLPYLQAIFRVDAAAIDYKHMNGVTLDDSCRLSNYFLPSQSSVCHFDLELSLIYNKTEQTIDCEWAYLIDAFEKSTIDMHCKNFILLLTRLFESNDETNLRLSLAKILTFTTEEENNVLQWQVANSTAAFTNEFFLF